MTAMTLQAPATWSQSTQQLIKQYLQNKLNRFAMRKESIEQSTVEYFTIEEEQEIVQMQSYQDLMKSLDLAGL
jgi:hypothetical protein